MEFIVRSFAKPLSILQRGHAPSCDRFITLGHINSWQSSEWATLRQAEVYTRDATRALLALQAMHLSCREKNKQSAWTVAPLAMARGATETRLNSLISLAVEMKWCPETESNRRPHHYE
jgi:hypothetical protein